jgi:excisionase family DNA binding protein
MTSQRQRRTSTDLRVRSTQEKSQLRSPGGLRRSLCALPDDAYVPMRWVRCFLQEDSENARARSEQLADRTVAEVARALGRSPSTVRGWCASGKLKAYKLNGREWRIRPEDLQAFFDKQAEPSCNLETNRSGPTFGKNSDLEAWRKHV